MKEEDKEEDEEEEDKEGDEEEEGDKEEDEEEEDKKKTKPDPTRLRATGLVFVPDGFTSGTIVLYGNPRRSLWVWWKSIKTFPELLRFKNMFREAEENTEVIIQIVMKDRDFALWHTT